MIASLFSKTRPINYLLIGLSVTLCFFIQEFLGKTNELTSLTTWTKILLFSVVIVTLLLVNFISLKNTLTKNDNYALILYFLFLLMFSDVFQNIKIVLSNFFLLLALRRLISLKSLISPKEKIFDASFWIFLATIFHFWSIIYIVLVFISVLFHSGKDYRNWLIPFISFFCVWILYIVFNLFFYGNYDFNWYLMTKTSFDFTNFKNIYQNLALAIYAAIAFLFFASQLIDYQNKPLNMQSSYKQIYFSFVLAALIYLVSASKSNDMLIYSFAPLSILGANLFEKMEANKFKEGFLYLLFLIGIFFFIIDL